MARKSTQTDYRSLTVCGYCVAHWPAGQPFPPALAKLWLNSILQEILQERSVSSRGRHIPRGLKRKMSSYPLRRTAAPTQRKFFAPLISRRV